MPLANPPSRSSPGPLPSLASRRVTLPQPAAVRVVELLRGLSEPLAAPPAPAPKAAAAPAAEPEAAAEVAVEAEGEKQESEEEAKEAKAEEEGEEAKEEVAPAQEEKAEQPAEAEQVAEVAVEQTEQVRGPHACRGPGVRACVQGRAAAAAAERKGGRGCRRGGLGRRSTV